jgi:hypothetical protein
MNGSSYLRISATVFAAVGCLHLARVIWSVPLQIGGWAVPMWLSWAGTFGAGCLSVWGFSAGRGRPAG